MLKSTKEVSVVWFCIGAFMLILFGGIWLIVKFSHNTQNIVEHSKYHVGQLVQTTSNQGSLKGQIKRVFKNELDKPSYDLALAGTTFTVQVYEYELESIPTTFPCEDVARGMKWFEKASEKSW